MGHLGIGEIALIAIIVLVLFGAKRLPELARSAGSSIREFKEALNETKDEIKAPSPSETPKPPSA